MLEEIRRTNRNMFYEYVEYVEYSPKNPHLDKKIIHIASTLTEVDTYYPHTIEIAADIEDMIKAVLNE
jgi:acetolactate synthase I/II/III large subunit